MLSLTLLTKRKEGTPTDRNIETKGKKVTTCLVYERERKKKED